MPEPYKRLIPTLSDDKVRGYILNKDSYPPVVVEFAMRELRKRGVPLDPLDDADEVESDAPRAPDRRDATKSKFFMKFSDNIVHDELAPLLYPRVLIYLFTMMGTSLLGGILLALNLKKLKKSDEIPSVLIFSAIFSTPALFLTRAGWELVSLVPAYILGDVFWKKYVGRQTEYRAITLDGLLLVLFALALAGFFGKHWALF